MKVYVTTYCLTKGIIEADLEDVGDYYYVVLGENHLPAVFKKTEAFRSLSEAKINAEDRRTKKIKSLEKKIEKLQALRF